MQSYTAINYFQAKKNILISHATVTRLGHYSLCLVLLDGKNGYYHTQPNSSSILKSYHFPSKPAPREHCIVQRRLCFHFHFFIQEIFETCFYEISKITYKSIVSNFKLWDTITHLDILKTCTPQGSSLKKNLEEKNTLCPGPKDPRGKARQREIFISFSHAIPIVKLWRNLWYLFAELSFFQYTLFFYKNQIILLRLSLFLAFRHLSIFQCS